MSRLILTALPIPAVASHSSPQCLQWSADGQVAFLAETSVVILVRILDIYANVRVRLMQFQTPDHGVNFDNESIVRATPVKDDAALGWFKTGIQSDPGRSNREPDIETVHWPDYSQTWGAVSLGSIDFSLIGLAISPSGLSSTGHCIFATLSSNMDVMLWTASNNYLKGKWEQTFALTPFLLQHLAPGAPESCSAAAVLQAQITTIAWMPQADFGLEPKPHLDGSLLITGSRAGFLTFLRYVNGAAPEIIATLSVSDYWITHTSFTGWKVIAPGRCEGLLAYASSRGSVGIVKITQTAKEVKGTPTYGPKYAIKAQFEHEKTPVYGSEERAGVTALQWAHVPGRTPILITCVPGLVKLWSARAIQDLKFWTGHRALRIQLQKIYIGCSPFHPVSGIAVLPDEDTLVVTLADGSFHVVAAFSTDPAWKSEAPVQVEDQADVELEPELAPDADVDADGDVDMDEDVDMDMDMDMDVGGDADVGLDMVNSKDLSQVSREVFLTAESARPKTAREEEARRKLDRADMGCIAAARSYDGAGCLMWIYDALRPSDFSYKHDAKHNSMFVVTQMWDGVDDDGLLKKLETLLANVKAGSGLSPLYVLRPLLIHLRDPIRLGKVHTRLLDILRLETPTDNSPKVIAPTWDGGELSDDFRQQFRASLATNLFGWDDLLSLRMRLSLADFAWKLSSSEERRAACGVVAQGLLGSISHRILRTLIRYLLSVVKLLTPKEVPFVSRIIVQSLLPGCPEDLRDEGNQLSLAIQPFLKNADDADATASIVSQLKETCPACGVEVQLQDITSAVCANGHTWPRCSVTTFILATASPRTCVGCSRKAFLPPSAKRTLPPIGQGWVVEELLEAVQRCLFCNNGFVSIL